MNIAGVNIRHKNGNHKLEFYVVRSKASCTLDLSDSIALKLIRKIDTVKNSEVCPDPVINQIKLDRPKLNTKPKVSFHSSEILNEYRDLMSGIGCINDYHKIQLKKDAIPVVPFMLLEKFPLHLNLNLSIN